MPRFVLGLTRTTVFDAKFETQIAPKPLVWAHGWMPVRILATTRGGADGPAAEGAATSSASARTRRTTDSEYLLRIRNTS